MKSILRAAVAASALLFATGCSSEEAVPEPASRPERTTERASERPAAEPRREREFLDDRPVPPIDAKVAAVEAIGDQVLVLLTVGSDDKVEKGFHFSIYRGNEFIGKVVVEKVLKDSCGCRVLFVKEGQSVQTGDNAATRLQ